MREALPTRPLAFYGPLKISLFWLLGTYFLFLILGDTENLTNGPKLAVFVFAATGFLALGYVLSMKARIGTYDPSVDLPEFPGRGAQFLVLASALYYLAYGVSYLREYSVASVPAILTSLADPGGAYAAKFATYERQNASEASNGVIQLITIAAVFSAPLLPFLVVYWRRLPVALRIFSVIAVCAYSSFFLAIGTLVGLGNLLIFLAVGVAVARARGAVAARTLGQQRSVIALALVLIAFAAYMSYNQSQRLIQFGNASAFEPNPIVASVFGDSFGRGASVTMFYPTHGYRGLAYNLDTPFHWTKGRGASRALDSYLAQYGMGATASRDTYPARTEARTGWPSGTYWATIYPWLASDLTFPGAALFMILVGWWFARWWFEALVYGSRLSLLLVAQAATLIAFVPANNALGISRGSLICVATLLACYAIRPKPGRAVLDLTRNASRKPHETNPRSVRVPHAG
ncbi:hypothetical protein GCM10011584_29030 [Nocardioides phosphati]|uniref:Oligosaccharide repeat unit polymerase n=1 Tax=Nocardioides phosphati TaxID=1867775 RepID=A0ABQ2NI33_9ACTN|nr:hypothetical protein [Nocardioides phosphati]GGO92494.1 hypothetical protein GCM10011584_29030 [Nocardioides phosphati]